MSANIDRYREITIDVTDHKTTHQEIVYLQKLPIEIKFIDTNWFGGVWPLEEYLNAEEKLNKEADKILNKKMSPFENFICAYHYASNRKYKIAPKGSPFQMCRSYVDVLNHGYCVCVGFATVLKKLCDKLGIECAVQGCLAKNKFGQEKNHANCLVYLKDSKYKIDGLYYSDPRMDCLNFGDITGDNFSWKLNMLAIPITDIGKIDIKIWNDDTIIEMNDFQSLYYSRKMSQPDKEYLSKFFSKALLDKIIEKKYCKPIGAGTLLSALQQIGVKSEALLKFERDYFLRSELFFSDVSSNKIGNETNKRIDFTKYLESFVYHLGRRKSEGKLDCATFVRYAFMNFFNEDVLQNGIGQSWTGKILTSSRGKNILIDENLSLQEKIEFIDTKCKAGDILFFHRQSKNEKCTTESNWFPGHCGIYLGNHKYIDSRLTTRGNVAIVDIEKDKYMKNFIGCKNVISFLEVNKEKTGEEIIKS